MADEVGFQTITASGVIGISGQAVAVYGFAWKSNSTPSVVTFKNGSTTGGTAVFDATGTASATAYQTLPSACVFPGGLFVTLDGNVTTLTVVYRQVLTT